MPMNQDKIYQRIGEFAVSFQWLENKIREIGWLILSPNRTVWPPRELRTETNRQLIDRVQELFLRALPACELGSELEESYRTGFIRTADQLHGIRQARNRILHSAFIEFKAGGEVLDLMRSNPKLLIDSETGTVTFDDEFLTEESFAEEFDEMARIAFFLNQCHIQLIARYPHGSGKSTAEGAETK